MPSNNEVVVAVPIYRERLTAQEQLAVRHLLAFLGEYEMAILLPEGLDSPLSGAREVRFAARDFSSVDSYSRLLLSERFYRRFASFEVMLIYQLDCLVFGDRLMEWCASPYDYIGAPWLKDPGDSSRGFSRVGNGGLSLRRVGQFLRVLTSSRYVEEPVSFWKDYWSVRLPDLRGLGAGWRPLKRARVLRSVQRGVEWYARNYTLNEDHFWADRAHLFLPDFRVAPIEIGLEFSFEVAPRFCFEQNGGRLPFGCHAWERHDPEFWRPHLLSDNGPCAAPE